MKQYQFYSVICLMVFFGACQSPFNAQFRASDSVVDLSPVDLSKIRVGEDHAGGLGWANAHAPIKSWIKLNGKKYSDLFGVRPYFQNLKGLPYIAIFQNKNNITNLILINVRDGKEYNVRGSWIGFGYGLCRPDHDFHDVLEATADNKYILVTSVTPSRTYQAKIDLESYSKVSEIKFSMPAKL